MFGLSAAAVTGIVGVGGIAANLYGQNKQAQAQRDANAANSASIANSDLNSWKAYLMQRGLNPVGVTTFGEIPTNAAPMNTKLPLWANVNIPQAGAKSRWQKVGAGYGAPGTLNTGAYGAQPASPAIPQMSGVN